VLSNSFFFTFRFLTPRPPDFYLSGQFPISMTKSFLVSIFVPDSTNLINLLARDLGMGDKEIL